MKEILIELGIDKSLALAGLIGAISGVTGSKKPILIRLGSVLLGLAAAIYITPLTCEIFGIVNEKSKLGIAVVIGYLGIQGIHKLVISKLNDYGKA